MTTKHVVIKVDDSDDEQLSHPKVTKKKTYFNLVERIKIDQEIYDTVVCHPVVRESVGSTQLVDFEYLKFKDDNESEISSLSSDISCIFPWELFRAEPSKLHDIKSTWFLNACIEELEDSSHSFVKRFKLFVEKLFRFKNPLKKICTCAKANQDEGYVGILPVEEFKNLQDKYLREGIVTHDDLNFDKFMITYKSSHNEKPRRDFISFTRPASVLRPSAHKKIFM